MSCSAHRGEILHCLQDPHPSHAPAVEDDAAYEYFADGLLVIEDGYIRACGAADELLATLPSEALVHHHSHGLIVPGFVDTHIHYPQCSVIASYGQDLIDWLTRYTFPCEQTFAAHATATQTAKFFLNQLLANGTTTALVFGTVHRVAVDAFFTEAEHRNLRMICGKVLMDRNAPPQLCEEAAVGHATTEALIDRWHGVGRLRYAITPRFAPTSSDTQLRLAGQLLQQYPQVYLHTHLAESARECQWVAALFPQCANYLEVYAEHGLVEARSIFAHALHLDASAWQHLARGGGRIAFCPTSNLFLGSGLFDLCTADAHHIPVGLGTDIGGGDSFSLLRTINEAYKVQRLQNYALTPMRAFYLATLGGARVLNLDQYIGNFARGKEADFVVLDYEATSLIAYRLAHTQSLAEKLFVLQMLGDERAIRQTWIMGELVAREI